MKVGSRVSYSVAVNCMRLIRDGAVNDAFEALGIIPEDFELVCQSDPWIGAERTRITNVINSLVHGTVDVMGLPRIEVPVEFIASVLCVFIHPANLAVACRWMETSYSAEDISAGGVLEPVTAQRLFALCCQLASDAPPYATSWAKRMNRAIASVSDEPKLEVNDGLQV